MNKQKQEMLDKKAILADVKKATIEALRKHDDGLVMSSERDWIRGMVWKTLKPTLEQILTAQEETLVRWKIGTVEEFFKDVGIVDCSNCPQMANKCNDTAHEGEWISVEDRLPKSRSEILAYCNDGFGNPDIIIARYNWTMAVEYTGDWMTQSHHRMDEFVTHWQPLPAPPTPKSADEEGDVP